MDVEHAVPEDKALGVGHDGSLPWLPEQADEQPSVNRRMRKDATLYTQRAQRRVQAAVHPLEVVGTHVLLAGGGGHGGADALQRHAEELPPLAAGGLCSHDIAAQTVHGTPAAPLPMAVMLHCRPMWGCPCCTAFGTVGQAERAFCPCPAQLMVVAQDVQQAAHRPRPD